MYFFKTHIAYIKTCIKGVHSVMQRIGNHHQNNTMKFVKTYLFVLFHLPLLSSYVNGDHVFLDSSSTYDEVLRHVPIGPNSLESPPTDFKYNALDSSSNSDDVLRRVPKGPNPRESPLLDILRRVPKGPNPRQSPPSKEVEYKALDSLSNYYDVLRRVPKGPNPQQPPTFDVLRRVPSDYDPRESPPVKDFEYKAFDSSSSYDDVLRP